MQVNKYTSKIRPFILLSGLSGYLFKWYSW